jgi:hypothetical protein
MLDESQQCTGAATLLYKDIETLYKNDRFVAKNVVDDIVYLNSLIAEKPDKKDIAQSEWNITVPHDEAACTALGLEYWDSLKHSPTQKVCQGTGVLAIADFMDENNMGAMMFKGNNSSPLALT